MDPVDDVILGYRLARRARNNMHHNMLERGPMHVHPEVSKALRDLLMNDSRFYGVGYTEFILRAIENANQLVSE